ncbi:iron-sulfur protein [Methanocella sp. CWC-04]|uniref:Iron-sulfur protein n=1 Tax=Methanooceanicella nereidis TaxID=2052831 RepID=A0AAP2RDQ3_9EURY|nr:flavodoxin family protein [Methanocella sp. CWC-04]MCD1295389.1 iron-sulfur protein [Methanocella sp. CWC-04]
MKVIGIIASPRGKNSSTLRLLEAAIEGAYQAGAEVEIVDITKFRINYCKGCGSCYSKGECSQEDDFSYVMDKILDSDGIIFGSPNYIDSVTAQMKTLMDRMSDAKHCQLLDGKYGLTISTTGGGGEEMVIRYMNDFLIGCGATVIGGVGAAVGRDPPSINAAMEKAFMMGKDLVSAFSEKRVYPEQEVIHRIFRENFGPTIRVNKEKWAHDYLHWVQKGWV